MPSVPKDEDDLDLETDAELERRHTPHDRTMRNQRVTDKAAARFRWISPRGCSHTFGRMARIRRAESFR